jgi:penicillin V acylase-like amidase (Ntn superfamily)
MKNPGKILTFTVVFLTILVSTNCLVFACSDIIVNRGDYVVSARTMDFPQEMFTKLTLNPRGVTRRSMLPQDGDIPLQWTSKYGSITLNSFGPGASDGLNEHGLSAALLWLSSTEWPRSDGNPALSSNYWAQYCLDNFKTVTEAVGELKKIRVYSFSMPGIHSGEVVPLHLVLHDATGDSAVLEYVAGELVVHHPTEQPVVTNDPSYDRQLANLGNYVLFGGCQPLPGDTDPVSRFVRAASYLKTVPEPASGMQAVAWALGIIKNVSVPIGAMNTSGRTGVMASRTLWTCARNHKDRIYYFNTIDDPRIKFVDLKTVNFSRDKQIRNLDVNLNVAGDVSRYFRVENDPEKIIVK